ncbi:UNVERIFIED_ORG: hypothetical protein M2438_002940 [Methylobacterium sp. SuP10 SLI 274]|uniref:hypothetical protein n=1 Tax=Methylorubrum extorquens TaxID=408 RepID=UPI0020A0D4A2|nr:hypothetical protein [Methylorubrum extorquens]MDF9864172.1 hypothetical protein [Methylorubrum pseudosasae]MDH6637765.1 hypothetical protein [Methylobacterium sp. SuP10 SLI 274]MDH6666944.1 hypothetical protein [Methylorubrum zatmanii]MCP1558850.1 hypothetical protein [Methylorubrum extorquens]MDF9792483.1 hypothetical protein [Methylorubrum extorquens]
MSTIEANTPANTTYTSHVDQVGRSGFAIRNRAIVNGGIVRAEPALTSRWLAWEI